jgi:hypothetical protein
MQDQSQGRTRRVFRLVRALWRVKTLRPVLLYYDTSHTSKAFITSARVGGHNANPTNTIVSSDLEFALSSLVAAFDKQYESILDDEIALLARMFRALHKFCKEGEEIS